MFKLVCLSTDVIVLLLILHYNRNLKHSLIYATLYPSRFKPISNILDRVKNKKNNAPITFKTCLI